MSSYDCVLPIDFDHFSSVLIPQWLCVLSGDTALSDFVTAFIPHGCNCFNEDYRYSTWNLCCPAAYLKLFTERKPEEWRTDQIVKAEAYQNWKMEFGHMEVLCAAIKQSCAVELPDGDPLAGLIWNDYYNRLHDPPHVQVAGTKSRYRFLDGIYSAEPKQSKNLCAFHRKHTTVGAMPELLELLFLGVRALPGSELLAEVPAWRGSDDLCIQGYLMPKETGELAKFIDQMQIAADERDDTLFALFADRLQRAADVGAGLITIHDGL